MSLLYKKAVFTSRTINTSNNHFIPPPRYTSVTTTLRLTTLFTGPVLHIKILFIYICWSKSLPINTATLSYSTSHIPDTNCAYCSFLSASLYFSKRGAYWDRLCRDVVGRWLVVTRVHCGQRCLTENTWRRLQASWRTETTCWWS